MLSQLAHQKKLQQYRQNQNTIHGILVKNSDMSYQMKSLVTRILSQNIKALHKQTDAEQIIASRVTSVMEDYSPGAWICVIGRRFVANITHEPDCFFRGSTENYHILVMKVREYVIEKLEKEKIKKAWYIEQDMKASTKSK